MNMDNIGLRRNIHLLAETLVNDKLSVRKQSYVHTPLVESLSEIKSNAWVYFNL